MKNLVLSVLLIVVTSLSLYGQNYNTKEHDSVVKLAKNELNAKASKAARKAAKSYKKEGWKVAPGHLPLEKQLDRSYMIQYELDENYMPKFIISEAMSVGQNYDAAKIQALELAKLSLASKISSNLVGLVDNEIANKQLSHDEAETITRTIMSGKNIISQKIGRVITLVECYRITKKGTHEVRVQIAYDYENAISNAKTAIREELEAKSHELSEKLDKMLNL